LIEEVGDHMAAGFARAAGENDALACRSHCKEGRCK